MSEHPGDPKTMEEVNAEAAVVMISFNWLTGETMLDFYRERDHPGEDPNMMAEGVLHSIKPDFPREDGWHHLIVRNERAVGAFVDRMLGPDEEAPDVPDE